MDKQAPYQVYAYVGASLPAVSSGTVVDITPEFETAESALKAVTDAGLNSSDLRSRVVFLVDDDPSMCAKSILAYAALIGLARRRVDVAFGAESEPIVMAAVDATVKALGDAGKPEHNVEVVLVDDPDVDLAPSPRVAAVSLDGGLSEDVVSTIRYARRAIMSVSEQTSRSLPEFITIASMRARGERERLPLIAYKGELIDTEVVRRACQDLRKDLRGDDRSALLEFVGAPAYYANMLEASKVPILEVLARLGARSKEVTSQVIGEDGEPTGETSTQTLWHCLHPQEHTNGDASPSARVTVSEDGREFFRCYRCLPERVDSLRLVMWAKGLTGDEAADWILA